MNDTNKLFSENLNRFLKYYGMSQAELAERLGYGHAAVSTWCRAEKFPRLSTIDKMTEIFHCSRSDLLERESTDDSIREAALYSRLYEYISRLNYNGVDKALVFFEDLNPKFYKGDE